MRHRGEVAVIAAIAGFALAGVASMHMLRMNHEGDVYLRPGNVIEPQTVTTVDGRTDAQVASEWFRGFRMYCNPVEVASRLRWQPAPATDDGAMHEAACYALAGKVDEARGVIEGLPRERRYQAAGVVFNAAHPAADAGDELAAGPIMELVVEYWPNHYMALYHAGAAAYERGEHERARVYLKRFLVEYEIEDGWRSNAQRMVANP